MMTSLRIPDGLAARLDQLVHDRRASRSELIREALEQYCRAAEVGASADRLALLRSLVTYAGSGRRDGGARSEHYLREIFRARGKRRPR